jgi:hypothetical protein
MAYRKLTELEDIEERLDFLRVKENFIHEKYWEEFMKLKQPVDERMARLRAGRKSGWVPARVEAAYMKRVLKVREKAMGVLQKIDVIADEAARLRTRRSELLRKDKTFLAKFRVGVVIEMRPAEMENAA